VLHLGASGRERSKRHVPGASVLDQWRAAIFRLASSDRRRDGSGTRTGTDSGRVRAVPAGNGGRAMSPVVTPQFGDLLARALSEPGIVSRAYSAFHGYSIGNQILAIV